MIPYEDLVTALTAWRARQGLPVSHVPTPAATSGSGPARTAPPSAPPRGFTTKPPPLPAEHDDALDVDSALIEEGHYENEGDDFGMKFGAPEADAEATSIGTSPQRDSFGGTTAPGGATADDDVPPRNRNEDW